VSETEVLAAVAVGGGQLLADAVELADVRVITVYVTAPAIITTPSTQTAIFHHWILFLLLTIICLVSFSIF
jgi:hypothetical protein